MDGLIHFYLDPNTHKEPKKGAKIPPSPNLTKEVKLNNQDGSVLFRKFELKREMNKIQTTYVIGKGTDKLIVVNG